VILNRNNAGGITIPNFKLCYGAIVTKTTWYWHKNRHEDQWNRKEDPEINSHSYSHLVLAKKVKHTHWRKNRIFNK
jgi:hypothetical protein